MNRRLPGRYVPWLPIRTRAARFESRLIFRLAAAYARLGPSRRGASSTGRGKPGLALRYRSKPLARRPIQYRWPRRRWSGTRQRSALPDIGTMRMKMRDFGVPSDRELHRTLAGQTPTTAPGTTTIRTAGLERLLAERKPIVIDALLYSWGRSIPGAIGLKNVGWGGSLSDASAGPPAPEDAGADEGRPCHTGRGCRLQFRAVRRSQSGASPRSLLAIRTSIGTAAAARRGR